MSTYDCEPNRWKGFLLGMAGSVVGLMAMDLYWQRVAPLLTSEGAGDGKSQQAEPLDDISLVGKQHKKDESSTVALGRIVYQQVIGKEPRSLEAKTVLSYLVHWGYGILQGVAFRRGNNPIEVALISVGKEGRWQLPKGLVNQAESKYQRAAHCGVLFPLNRRR